MNRSPLVLISAVGLFTLGFLAPVGRPESRRRRGPARVQYVLPERGPIRRSRDNRPPSPVTILSSGTVTADADGYVPVTLKCNATVQCMALSCLYLRGWSNRPQGRCLGSAADRILS